MNTSKRHKRRIIRAMFTLVFIIVVASLLVYGLVTDNSLFTFLSLPVVVMLNIFVLYFKSDKEKSRFDFIYFILISVILGFIFFVAVAPRYAQVTVRVPASQIPEIYQSYNGTVLLSCVRYTDDSVGCMPMELRNVGEPFHIPHFDDVKEKGICDYDVPNEIFSCDWGQERPE